MATQTIVIGDGNSNKYKKQVIEDIEKHKRQVIENVRVDKLGIEIADIADKVENKTDKICKDSNNRNW